MSDSFAAYSFGTAGPATKIVAVSSGVDFPGGPCRALLVGTGGTADLVDSNGDTVSSVPLVTGYNPLRVSKVTLGTASAVFALY